MPPVVDLEEAKNNGDRALAGRRTLTAAQNRSVLRGESEGIKFPTIMWFNYIIGSQWEGSNLYKSRVA